MYETSELIVKEGKSRSVEGCPQSSGTLGEVQAIPSTLQGGER